VGSGIPNPILCRRREDMAKSKRVSGNNAVDKTIDLESRR